MAAKTSYYTMNGMLIGESTSGVMRNYVTDALGSVVGTVSNGVAENTYQYKPYGSTLTKTGTADDPRFLWNGRSGYRGTGLTSCSHYVRGRHFSNIASAWTTVDAAWPQQAGFVYARCAPVTVRDSSGFDPACDVDFPEPKMGSEVAQANFIVGVLSYMAYVPVKFDCKAKCPFEGFCFMDQDVQAYGYVSQGKYSHIYSDFTKPFGPDDAVQCFPGVKTCQQNGTGGSTCEVQGMDQPGHYAILNDVPGTHNRADFGTCKLPSGMYDNITTPNVLQGDGDFFITVDMFFNTYCTCCAATSGSAAGTAQLPPKLSNCATDEEDWSFSFTIEYKGGVLTAWALAF